MLDEKLWTALCGRGSYKLSEFLQYAYYDEIDNIYIMKDSSVGFILEIYPVPGMDEKNLKNISDIFVHQDIRDGDSFQIINYASDEIDTYIKNYLFKKTSANSLLSDYCMSNARFYLESGKKGFKGFDKLYRPKDFRVYLAYRTSTVQGEESIFKNIMSNFKFWKGIKEVKFEEFERKISRCLDIRISARNLLELSGTFARDLPPDGLINFYCSFFGRKGHYSPYDRRYLIADQLIDSEVCADLTGEACINFGKRKSSVFTVKKDPEYITPAMTYEMLGSMLYDSSQMPPNSLAVLNVKCRERNKSLDKLDIQIAAEEHFVKGYRKDDKRKKELEKLKKETMSGFTPHEAYMAFITMSDAENGINEKDANLRITKQMESAGYMPQMETMIKLPLFLSSLPLNFNSVDLDFFKRKKLYTSWNIACMAPVYGDYKGTFNPSQFYISRRSQLVGMDYFSRDMGSNQVVIIIGQSGLGKSFLIQGIVANYLAEDAIACLIEVADESNSSYKNGTFQFGGEYIDLTNFKYSLNPFAAIPDEGLSIEDWNILVMILSFMASPNEPINQVMEGFLDKAVKRVIEGSGNKGSIDEIYRVVREYSTELSDRLYNYTSGARFGALFDPLKPGITFGNNLTTIQIPPEEIIGKNALTLMYLTGLYRFSLIVYGKKFKGVKKLAVYDEAHNILYKQLIAEMLEKQSRQYRRCDGAVIIGTQNLEDIYLNANAKALVDNAAYQIIFRQPEATLERLQKENKLIINNEIKKLFMSINNRRGMSEFMLVTQSGQSILRHIGTPMDTVLFGSSSIEKSRIEEMVESGRDFRDSVNILAEEIANG